MSDFMITRRGGGFSGKGTPLFNYTGSYELVDDSGAVVQQDNAGVSNWRLRLLTSGTLTFVKLGSAKKGINAFLVGGAAAGGAGPGDAHGGNGGSGYSNTYYSQVEKETAYAIEIGGGGLGASAGLSGADGSDGGSTSAFGYTANGGLGGKAGSYSGNDPINGANGEGGSPAHAFAETDGDIYAQAAAYGVAGAANTGTGGGGTNGNYSVGKSGGSGIVIIRNHRTV